MPPSLRKAVAAAIGGGAIAIASVLITGPSGCIDSREVRKKPGGHWIIRDLTGLDLVGLASL